jgi:hypothetical protein
MIDGEWSSVTSDGDEDITCLRGGPVATYGPLVAPGEADPFRLTERVEHWCGLDAAH